MPFNHYIWCFCRQIGRAKLLRNLRQAALDPNGHLRKTLQWLRRWIGIPLAFAALLVIGQRIYNGWATIQATVGQIRLGWLFAGMAVIAASIVLLGRNWFSILISRGIHVPWPNILVLYLLTNLSRYLPGGIWHFAGRIAWLAEQGHGSRSVIESLMLEQTMVLVSAGAIGFSLSGLTVRTDLAVGLGIIAEALLVMLAGIATGYVKLVHKGLPSKSQGGLWRWAFLVLSYNLFWIINGFATVCLYAALVGWGGIRNPITCVNLVGCTALSWAASYIVIFVPGGWGIRELTFMYLLSQDLSSTMVFVLPVLSRLAQVLVELCEGAFSLLWQLRFRSPRMSN